jgi:hypothetical protein
VTELHNMSVPPRTVLAVKRERLAGRCFRVDLGRVVVPGPGRPWGPDSLARAFREAGAACGLALLECAGTRIPAAEFGERLARCRSYHDPAGRLEAICGEALAKVRLPARLGFFLEEPDPPGECRLDGAAALAVLAARSGPLYLPGRFEPSLVAPSPVTLFFPQPEAYGARR